MWLYTDIGFFSIVQKDGAGTLTIRSRVRKDLENFIKLMPGSVSTMPDIIESVDSDYRYRIIIPHIIGMHVVNDLVGGIRYGNFKDHIHAKDPRRADVYNGIWGRSLALEELDEPDE